MRKTAIALLFILMVFVCVSCEQEPPLSHDEVMVIFSKEAGSRHTYKFDYWSYNWRGHVYFQSEPNPRGWDCDYFKLEMNTKIHLIYDDVDVGYFVVTEPYQEFNPLAL